MMNRRFFLANAIVVWFFIGNVVSAVAGELSFQSSEQRTPLIELYTSEGCSSCPPAEAWLSKLKTEAGLWKDFVPVAFHVDYWDHLGWRDRFASAVFTERQRAYAAQLKTDSIYTPEFIVNGREWSGWFSNPRLPKVGAERIGILSVVAHEDNTFAIVFRPLKMDATQWEAHLALLASEVSSKIGEIGRASCRERV